MSGRRISASILAAVCGLAVAETACGAGPVIRPSSPPDLCVTVESGGATLPDGKQVTFEKTTLRFDPPEVKERTVTVKSPGDHASWWDPWQPWPKQGKPLTLKPEQDEEGTPILGGLFRHIDPDNVVVTSADGSRTFKRDEDYVFLDDWGQIGNLGGRLGKPEEAEIKVTFRMALQRLDLVQVDARGKVTVKKGTSVLVCPALPEADAGAAALAGIYLAPWKAARNPNFDGREAVKAAADYAITEHEVFAVDPAAPVEPVNKAAAAGTLKKLREGRETRIAFMGASIALGAEAPAWWANLWTEKNLGYPSRVVVELRRRFPKATVAPIEAFKGGTQTKYGLEMMDKVVLPGKPDLVFISFGGNDVSGAIGKGPNNPPEQFKEDMRKMAQRAKESGAEVVLVVTMQQNPWLRNKVEERWPAYRRALLDLAKEENVGCADVYGEWVNQATRGVPAFSQLHNWVNHPGKAGHKVYADVILRFFD